MEVREDVTVCSSSEISEINNNHRSEVSKSPDQSMTTFSIHTVTDVDSEGKRKVRKRTSSFFRRSSIIRSPPNLLRISEYFRDCITPNNRIQILLYLQAYKEVTKFLAALGTLLSFASRDLEQKVTRIEAKMASDNKMHYRFLDDLLKFEVERKVVDKEGKELGRHHSYSHSATRNIFRLHQALAFLVKFFTYVRNLPHAKIHFVVNEAYKETISKNHNWLVRKTAALAFHALPSRSSLITRMGDDVTETELMSRLEEITIIAKQVYATSALAFNAHSRIALHEPTILS